MAVIVKWDGSKVPKELEGLPAGRYVLESIDDAAPLSADEEAGIEAALDSLRRGDGVSAAEARARFESTLRR